MRNTVNRYKGQQGKEKALDMEQNTLITHIRKVHIAEMPYRCTDFFIVLGVTIIKIPQINKQILNTEMIEN